MPTTHTSFYETAPTYNGNRAIVNGEDFAVKNMTPNFRKIIEAGGSLPMNPYQRRVDILYTPVGQGLTDGAVDTLYDLVWYDSWLYGSLSTTNALGSITSYRDNFLDADAKAVRSFYENARGTDVQALVTLGELPKTLGLVASSAKRIAGFMRGMKRLDVTGAFNSLGLETGRHYRNVTRGANSLKKSGTAKNIKDFASNTWLEVQYGWKPLLYEIEGAVGLLDNQWAHTDYDLLIKGSGSEKFGIQSDLPTPDSLLPSPYWDGVARGGGKCKVRYTCAFRVIHPTLRNASSIGLTNLGEVAWELTPYSFVIDWFVPIGAYISSLTALYGLDFVRGCKTETIKFSGEAVLSATRKYQSLEMTPVSLSCSRDYKDCTRTLINAPPSPLIGLRPKDLDEALNVTKAVTSLALMNNSFR